MIMKTNLKLFVMLVSCVTMGAQAASVNHSPKHASKQSRSKFTRTSARVKPARHSALGDAMRPQKSLEFDGRTIESLHGGKYDSFTHLDDGTGANSSRKLYSLPRDFSNRVADEGTEMRYRP